MRAACAPRTRCLCPARAPLAPDLHRLRTARALPAAPAPCPAHPCCPRAAPAPRAPAGRAQPLPQRAPLLSAPARIAAHRANTPCSLQRQRALLSSVTACPAAHSASAPCCPARQHTPHPSAPCLPQPRHPALPSRAAQAKPCRPTRAALPIPSRASLPHFPAPPSRPAAATAAAGSAGSAGGAAGSARGANGSAGGARGAGGSAGGAATDSRQSWWWRFWFYGYCTAAAAASAKRVLRYLCCTSGMGLVLGGWGLVVLTGHSDASWANDQATQRSSHGYIFSLGSGSVSWRSTCSSSVLGSSCEAESYAGAMSAQDLHWLTFLLTDSGKRLRSPPVLYVDNKAMLALCHEQRLEHRTKHIDLRYFLAR
ncbi:unnamed protein product [Closterium sp. NIES-53]